MENNRLNLPVGIQRFEEIRKSGYVYVDKTKYLVEMIRKGKIYFLARPRRFGKSITVSTFEAMFAGEKELFKGLYAEEFMNDFETSPVVRLDMSKVVTDSGIDGIRESIREITIEAAESLGVDVPKDLSAGNIFRKLIINTAREYNKQIVVLIDEYDAAYTEFVNNPDMAIEIRNVLRSYYKQLKSNEEHIRFIFITGISKFAKFGVFSSLNNLDDISLNPKYAEICGYTEDEIIRYFPDYIEETALEMQITTDVLIKRMREYYNGFTFDRNCTTRLYNPFSTLRFFSEKEFYSFWIDTGQPLFLAEYMKNRNLTIEEFRNFPVSIDFAKSPGDVDTTPPQGFLLQCGYLTLREGIFDELSLDYPNTEVLNSMSELLAQNILHGRDEDFTRCRGDLLVALQSKDSKKLVLVFNRVLAGIPYDDFRKSAEQDISFKGYDFSVYEWHYRSMLICFLRGCGVVTFAEMHSNLGRSDIMLSHKGNVWIIELKVAKEGEEPAQKAEEAIRQIEEKNYAKAYPDAVCLGLAIDDDKRQITELRVRNEELRMKY